MAHWLAFVTLRILRLICSDLRVLGPKELKGYVGMI